MNLNKVNFRFAISFEDYRTEESKFDPRYVQWLFRLHNAKDEVKGEKLLKYHPCTDEDFKEFYPIWEE